MKLRYPTKASLGRSWKVALFGGVASLLLAMSSAIKEARQDIHTTTVYEQLGEKVSSMLRGESRCKEVYYAHEDCLTEARQTDLCVKQLQSLLLGPNANPTVGELVRMDSLAAAREQEVLAIKDCAFLQPLNYPRWVSNRSPEVFLKPVGAGLAGGLTLGLYFLILFWIVEYPHIGWRRLIIVTSPIIGLLAGNWRFRAIEQLPESFCFGLGTIALSGILLILGRKIVLWIKAGFDTSGVDG